MKVLIIGGTGIISTAVVKELVLSGHDVTVLNRGNANDRIPDNVRTIVSDIEDEAKVKALLEGCCFDCVADFIVQKPEHIDRDYRLFNGKTRQYIFVSSGCIYQKPLNHYEVTESTPVNNPYWEYAVNKTACENRLQEIYRATGFPMTVIRPGHTYDEKWLPLEISGWKGCWAVLKRMLEGKSTIIPGDGTSLWCVTHNSDFAKAFKGLVGNPQTRGEVIQISSDEILTWNQIYEAVADALNVPLKPFYVSSMFLHNSGPYNFKCCLIGERAQSTVFKNDKLKRLVPGFRAEVPFREGIKKSVEFLLSHPEYQEEDPVFDAWCDALEKTLTVTANELKEKFPDPLVLK